MESPNPQVDINEDFDADLGDMVLPEDGCMYDDEDIDFSSIIDFDE